MSYTHKSFFEEPSIGELRKRELFYSHDSLVEKILNTPEGSTVVVDINLIPLKYHNDSWYFLRHAQRVAPTARQTINNILRGKITPVDLRRIAFNAIEDPFHSGYEYQPWDIHPYAKRDRSPRRVSLVECLEGARLYAYAHQVQNVKIDIEKYEDAAAVQTDGAIVPVKIPSRQKGHRRYSFNLTSVAVVDTLEKYKIAWSTAAGAHECKRDQYMTLRYSTDEPSILFNWCAHGIAAYLEYVDRKYQQEKNIVPLEMSQIALPTRLTVEYYKRLCDSLLISDSSEKSKNHVRKPNKAEREILLWMLVQEKKHDATFYSTEKLREYDWKLRRTTQ